MPDGLRPETDAADQDAVAADERLVSRVRLRLVVWSGGITLLVLLVLGIVLYVAVARSLETTAVGLLHDRAAALQNNIGRPGRFGAALGFAFGGDASGTAALLIDTDGQTVLNLPPDASLIQGIPVADGIQAAKATGHEDVRTTTVAGFPLRVLSDPVRGPRGMFVIQVIQDRREEQRTLDTTLAVLLVGGIVAFLVASAFGAFYARRALVPIRQSLGSQRLALRRQREFAADASHELRTPLTVIRSSVEHLRRNPGTEPSPAAAEALEDIDAEVGHLTALVDDLLLLARSDSGTITLTRLPVDLGDVAAESAGALATL